MKHLQKIVIYLFVFTINIAFIQIDLLSQSDSLVKIDNLIIGGVYKIKLKTGKASFGELQEYDSISISILSDEKAINIRKEQIMSIEIPKNEHSTKPSYGNLHNKYSYWSVSVIGGGIIPVGDFANSYNFSGSIGADINFHINPFWTVYANVTNNFLSSESKNYYYYYNEPDKSPSYFELTIGPRFYFTHEKVKGFIEAGMGLYNLDASSSSNSKASFGVNFGAGADIQLSRKVDLVIKVKSHNIILFWLGNTLLTNNYVGIYTGVNYNF